MPCTYMLSGREAVIAAVLLAQRACRGVTRVREGVLTGGNHGLVELLKIGGEMNTSPRISISSVVLTGQPLWDARDGAHVGVTSSPVVPSPRVATRTKCRCGKSRFTARPSIFSSVSHCGALPVRFRRSPRSWSARLAAPRRKTSSRHMRCRWVTGAASMASPPTSWVGESLAMRCGCSASVIRAGGTAHRTQRQREGRVLVIVGAAGGTNLIGQFRVLSTQGLGNLHGIFCGVFHEVFCGALCSSLSGAVCWVLLFSVTRPV